MSKPLLVALLVLAAAPAFAQFKVIGPDGKVTYTDRPPTSTQGRIQPIAADGGVAAAQAQLPFALREVAQRFPVTLYTASTCGEACALGRGHLTKRGVPFAERTAESAEERDAWQRLVGGSEAPVLKVGNQSLRGFTPAAWDETLDVAGYPKESQLPASYKAPAAMPLIEKRAEAPKTPAPAPLATPSDNSSNPAGIRF
jgi:glutaredoxin